MPGPSPATTQDVKSAEDQQDDPDGQERADVFGNALSHLILPASILGYFSLAYIARMTRSFMIEQLRQEAKMLGAPLQPGSSDSQDLNRVIDTLFRREGLSLAEAMEMVVRPIVNEIRSLPDDLHYLNCAYMSPLLRSVEEAGIEGVRRKRDPSLIAPEMFYDESDELRRLFARLVGLGDPERVAILPSVSYGIAVAARNARVERGQNVVVLDEQFPSNVYSWMRLCRERDAELRRVGPPETREGRAAVWNERLLEAIDTATAVVAVLGAFASPLTPALFEVTERRGIPLLTMSFSDPITDRGFKNVFQIVSTASAIRSASRSPATGPTRRWCDEAPRRCTGRRRPGPGADLARAVCDRGRTGVAHGHRRSPLRPRGHAPRVDRRRARGAGPRIPRGHPRWRRRRGPFGL